MKTVRDIMASEPVTLGEHLTLREAIDLLSDARVSGAPVIAGTAVVGVASRTDILGFVADSPAIPRERADVVEFGEVGVSVSESLDDESPAAYYADRWMDSEADVWSRITQSESPDWDRLDEHSVAEVMTRRIVSIEPEASVEDAARLMVDREIHRLLVMEGRELLGVVSTMDIVRAVAEGASQA
jgi:CBS domain-containing protein